MNEEQLIKEIHNLEDSTNPNELVCRNLRKDDWDTLSEWWAAWPEWTVPGRSFLPGNGTSGLMIQKNGIPITAGFIYETNSSAILFEWVISNPDYRQRDRGNAVEMLIVEAEKYAKGLGYKYMFTVGRNQKLIKKHEKLGWYVDPTTSHELTKKIG